MTKENKNFIIFVFLSSLFLFDLYFSWNLDLYNKDFGRIFIVFALKTVVFYICNSQYRKEYRANKNSYKILFFFLGSCLLVTNYIKYYSVISFDFFIIVTVISLIWLYSNLLYFNTFNISYRISFFAFFYNKQKNQNTI
jgi:hypothetical protein